MSSPRTSLQGLGWPFAWLTVGGCAYVFDGLGCFPAGYVEAIGLLLVILALTTMRSRLMPSALRTATPFLLALAWIVALVAMVRYAVTAPMELDVKYPEFFLQTAVISLTLYLMSRYCADAGAPHVERAWRKAAIQWGAIYTGILGVGLLLDVTWREPTGLTGLVIGLVLLILMVLPPFSAIAAARSTQIEANRPRGLCPKCRYDLAGLTDGVCPECARPYASHEQRGGGRDVPRLPRRALILQCVAYVGLASIAFFLRADSGFESIKPESMLITDATRTQPLPESLLQSENILFDVSPAPGAEVAQEELLRRIEGDLLAPGAAARLVQAALDVQADTTIPMGRWHHIFEALDRAGFVSPDQRRTFFTNSLALQLVPRPRVRAGAVLPFEIRATWRGGSGDHIFPDFNQGTQSVTMTVTSMSGAGIDLAPLPPTSRYSGGRSSEIFYFGFQRMAIKTPDLMPLAPDTVGPGTLTTDIRIDWIDRGARGWTTIEDLHDLDLPSSWTVTLTAPIDVVDAPTVAVIRDEQMPAIVASRYRVALRDPKWPGGSVTYGQDMFHELPAAVACDVLVRTPDADLPLGAFTANKAFGRIDDYLEFSDEAWAAIVDADMEVDIIFRPSADVAERTIDIEEVWVGEDVIVRGSRN